MEWYHKSLPLSSQIVLGLVDQCEMTDAEILDWLEAEFKTAVGCGPAHHIICQVHSGQSLRAAVQSAQQAAQADAASVGDKQTEKGAA